MIMNLKLDGLTQEIVDTLVERRVASNKNEAIRMMIRHYNEHFNIRPLDRYLEDQLAIKRMQQIDQEIESGKRKTISAKEALGDYAKYLE